MTNYIPSLVHDPSTTISNEETFLRSSRFPINSEAFASELIGNIVKMLKSPVDTTLKG